MDFLVPMKFQLGPALANIFVAFYETKLLGNPNKPHVYHSYVDDTFVVFNSQKQCADFFIFSTPFTPHYGSLLRKSVMVLIPCWMFWLSKVNLNLLHQLTESRQLQVNIHDKTLFVDSRSKLY